MDVLYDWCIDFINGISAIFEWLIDDISILGLFEIKPLWLVVGTTATIGILRRITGFL